MELVSKRSFRFSDIFSLSETGIVECKTQNITTPGSEVPIYNALSYAWGSSTESSQEEIILNEILLKVGSNLYRFLRFAAKRLPEIQKNIWIGTICT